MTHLAVAGQVSASSQYQALAAILFLYKDVLSVELPWLDGVTRAKKFPRIPVVLTESEVRVLLAQLDGTHHLIASLLYGSGLRLMEAMRLRVKDVDFERREITVRDGKGGKDRRTMLPRSLVEPLGRQFDKVRTLHEQDLQNRVAPVYLPHAGRELGWQYVFPAVALSRDPRSGVMRRHHLGEQAFQRAIEHALRRTPILKPASSHTLRHSFATHLIEDGDDNRTVPGIRTYAQPKSTRMS